ncbi:MAG: tetratricopeptide repeat protein [Thermoanaerobaculia bacterium]|nr:tetratricopeptide repeat protein [Thermoanaerobaculia bacterium]
MSGHTVAIAFPILAALALPPQEPTADLTTRFDRALGEASTAIGREEPQIAESRLRTALLEGWLLLGRIEQAAGNLDDARHAFDKASSVSVELRRPRLASAGLALRTGELDRAIQLLRQVVGADPGDLEARRMLASALATAGQMELAIQELEELTALSAGDLETSYMLATAYLKSDRLEAADELFAALARERPIPATWVLIGRTYRDYDEYERARDALRTALELDPETRRANFYLATVELLTRSQDGIPAAIDLLQKELAIAPADPLANLYLGMALTEVRRHEEALPHLLRAAENDSTRTDALQYIGKSYLALDRPADAARALTDALALAELEADTASTAARDDLRQRRLSSLHYQLAQALRRSGDEVGARPHFEAAEAYSARLTETSRDMLSRYLEDDVDSSAASAAADLPQQRLIAELEPSRVAALEQHLENGLAESYLNLGVLKARSRRFAAAAALFAEAAALRPEHDRIDALLGTALFNATHYRRAVEPLERASQSDPDNRDLQRMLALASMHSGDHDRAVALLRDDPGRTADRSLQYAYGVALVRSGRAPEAEAIFARLLTENADWPELNVLLGQAHAQQQDYEKALRFLERALDLDPQVAEAQATLGDIYLRQGRLEAAERAFRAELANHPRDDRARYTLAVVLDLLNRSEEAVGVIREILAERPDFADARYLLGKILLEQEEIDSAIGQLEAARSLSPGDANIHYQLGLAYQRGGRVEEARRAFEVFRSLKAQDSTPGES